MLSFLFGLMAALRCTQCLTALGVSALSCTAAEAAFAALETTFNTLSELPQEAGSAHDLAGSHGCSLMPHCWDDPYKVRFPARGKL